jgi:pyruvate/2-oxoglutarate dehydrogenase complex dihydrolipoamide acyltransferase (E2) component
MVDMNYTLLYSISPLGELTFIYFIYRITIMNAFNKNTSSIELQSLKTVSDLTKFLTAIDKADNAEITRFNETENAINLLKILRTQYSTLQHGNATSEASIGELPNAIYKPVIQGLYDGKKQTAELENREFTLNFEGYRDNQVRQLKYFIETGELFNRKKETQQEKAAVKIASLEKKAAAEAKAAEAAKAKAAKAAEAKAKAEAKAAEAKAKADALLIDAQEAADAMNENGGVEEFLTLADAQEAAQEEAEADAAEAKAAKLAEAEAAKLAEAEAAKAEATRIKLAEARLKAEALARGKASNNKTEPKLNFKTMNFSQDCKDTAASILEELEREATSAPELLYLAKLILDKYNK